VMPWTGLPRGRDGRVVAHARLHRARDRLEGACPPCRRSPPTGRTTSISFPTRSSARCRSARRCAPTS
jgi:hypothetical protein